VPQAPDPPPASALSTFDFLLPTFTGSATEEVESEQTQRVPETLKNKHFPVNLEG
jgi:hypothetical protein